VFLVVHIWTLNDWADHDADSSAPCRVAKARLLRLSLAALAAAFLLFCFLPPRTNAVAFGREPALLASFAVFAAAFVYLGVLAASGILPVRLGYSVVLLPFQTMWTLQTLRAGMEPASLDRLRRRYRATFALIGLNFLSLAIWPG